MNRYAQWVDAHGGWVDAPHPPEKPIDYEGLHFRLERRWSWMRRDRCPHCNGALGFDARTRCKLCQQYRLLAAKARADAMHVPQKNVERPRQGALTIGVLIPAEVRRRPAPEGWCHETAGEPKKRIWG